MQGKIKLNTDELNMMSLFQTVTNVTARDCIIDTKMNRIIFVVNKGEMGLAIGKDGMVIKQVEKLLDRSIELVEYSDNPEEFIKNCLNPKFVLEVRLSERLDKSKIAVVVVDQKKKGAILGKGGKNAEKARLLARRYFNIQNIQIVTSQ
ncbi:MAG: NusA-like transcription termination signal-binding factor [Nitrososphaerales archaeon]